MRIVWLSFYHFQGKSFQEICEKSVSQQKAYEPLIKYFYKARDSAKSCRVTYSVNGQ